MLEPSREPAVLEDPTGRRAPWLRRAGRVVFLLFLAWLVAIVLGGLGLGPVGHLPFTHVLRPSQGPPPARLPAPRHPSAADLVPAAPAPASVRRAHGLGPAAAPPGLSKRRAAPGRSRSAPGQTKPKLRGGSATAPGQTKPKPRGGSATAPGQVRKTTTTVTTVPHGHGRHK